MGAQLGPLKAARLSKRSIAIKGHRTSIALEPEFWAGLEAIADRRGVSLSSLINDVDQQRLAADPAPGLASALRVFALITR